MLARGGTPKRSLSIILRTSAEGRLEDWSFSGDLTVARITVYHSTHSASHIVERFTWLGSELAAFAVAAAIVALLILLL